VNLIFNGFPQKHESHKARFTSLEIV